MVSHTCNGETEICLNSNNKSILNNKYNNGNDKHGEMCCCEKCCLDRNVEYIVWHKMEEGTTSCSTPLSPSASSFFPASSPPSPSSSPSLKSNSSKPPSSSPPLPPSSPPQPSSPPYSFNRLSLTDFQGNLRENFNPCTSKGSAADNISILESTFDRGLLKSKVTHCVNKKNMENGRIPYLNNGLGPYSLEKQNNAQIKDSDSYTNNHKNTTLNSQNNAVNDSKNFVKLREFPKSLRNLKLSNLLKKTKSVVSSSSSSSSSPSSTSSSNFENYPLCNNSNNSVNSDKNKNGTKELSVKNNNKNDNKCASSDNIIGYPSFSGSDKYMEENNNNPKKIKKEKKKKKKNEIENKNDVNYNNSYNNLENNNTNTSINNNNNISISTLSTPSFRLPFMNKYKRNKPSLRIPVPNSDDTDSDFLNIKKMSPSAEKEMDQTIQMVQVMNKLKIENNNHSNNNNNNAFNSTNTNSNNKNNNMNENNKGDHNNSESSPKTPSSPHINELVFRFPLTKSSSISKDQNANSNNNSHSNKNNVYNDKKPNENLSVTSNKIALNPSVNGSLKNTYNNPTFDYNNNIINNNFNPNNTNELNNNRKKDSSSISSYNSSNNNIKSNSNTNIRVPANGRLYTRQISLDTNSNVPINNNICRNNYRIRYNSNHNPNINPNLNHNSNNTNRHYSFNSTTSTIPPKSPNNLSKSSGSIEIFRRRNKTAFIEENNHHNNNNIFDNNQINKISCSNNVHKIMNRLSLLSTNSKGSNSSETSNSDIHNNINNNSNTFKNITFKKNTRNTSFNSNNARNNFERVCSQNQIKNNTAPNQCNDSVFIRSKNFSRKSFYQPERKFYIVNFKSSFNRFSPYEKAIRKSSEKMYETLGKLHTTADLRKNILYIITSPIVHKKVIASQSQPTNHLISYQHVTNIENSASSNSGDTLIPDEDKLHAKDTIDTKNNLDGLLSGDLVIGKNANNLENVKGRDESEMIDNTKPPKLPPRDPLKYNTFRKDGKKKIKLSADNINNTLNKKNSTNSVEENNTNVMRSSWNGRSDYEKMQLQQNPQKVEQQNQQLLQLYQLQPQQMQHQNQILPPLFEIQQQQHLPLSPKPQLSLSKSFLEKQSVISHTNQHQQQQQHNSHKLFHQLQTQNHYPKYQRNLHPLSLHQRPIEIYPIPLSTSSSLEVSEESVNSDDTNEEDNEERVEIIDRKIIYNQKYDQKTVYQQIKFKSDGKKYGQEKDEERKNGKLSGDSCIVSYERKMEVALDLLNDKLQKSNKNTLN